MRSVQTIVLLAVGVLPTSLFAAEIRYAYDERKQLTSVVRDGCEAFGYGYDLAGNLLWASIGCKTNVYETNCRNQVDGVPYVPLYGISNIEAYCNTNGQVIASRTYSPYGQLVSGYGPPALYRRLHIWFASKYHDEETGLYYFGKRFYSPFLCRWLNQDPRGESGGINLYAFCCNNPVNNFDPDGCAYFAKRRINGGKFQNLASRVLQCPFVSDLADSGNFEIAHEQLFYEDGSGNIGWGMDADETGRGDFMRNEPYDGYVTREGGYNDCIMHIAEGLIGRPDHYQAWTGPKSKCNCQDYCDKLRNKYNEIKNSQEVRCKCKLPIIVR